MADSELVHVARTNLDVTASVSEELISNMFRNSLTSFDFVLAFRKPLYTRRFLVGGRKSAVSENLKIGSCVMCVSVAFLV